MLESFRVRPVERRAFTERPELVTERGLWVETVYRRVKVEAVGPYEQGLL